MNVYKKICIVHIIIDSGEGGKGDTPIEAVVIAGEIKLFLRVEIKFSLW